MRKGLVNKPLAYIIDLDGTLYDNNHRQHLIPEDKHDTAAWVEFNSACAGDTLREDMADLVRSILLSGREAIFLTGRGEAAREPTMKRILNDFNFIETPTLIMRPMDSMVPPESYKRTAVELLRASSRWGDYKFIAIEDDPAIVDVFRNIGLTVLHVDSQCCAVQPSNELADAKAALRRLATYARTYAGDIQYTGDHPIAVAEKLAGQSFGHAEQLDTAPAQFESLAGNSPETQEGSDADHVAAVLEFIGSYEAADIDSDTVELRFELDGLDTGSDVSITEYAARGAAIIRKLAGHQEVRS